jgi:manganese-dependent inorganic pyrophosphatase
MEEYEPYVASGSVIYAGVDYEAFGIALIKNGMDLENTPLDDLLTRDTKRYKLANLSMTIAQIMTPSDNYPKQNAAEIIRRVGALREYAGDDLYMAMFTDVISQVSYLYVSGSANLLAKLEYQEQPIVLENVMSRKKDLLPMIGKKLAEIEQ